MHTTIRTVLWYGVIGGEQLPHIVCAGEELGSITAMYSLPARGVGMEMKRGEGVHVGEVHEQNKQKMT
jgi:hypothetical protein